MAAEIITAKSLNLWYGTDGKTSTSDRGHHALKDINVDIPARQITALIGPSGCGKSTFGKTVMMLEKPTGGEVMFNYDGVFKDITKFNKDEMFEFRKKVQMVFQDPYSALNPQKKIYSSFEEPLKTHGITSQEAREERMQQVLKMVNIQPDYLMRYPHEFSGGQRQRIGLARALILNPLFVVCDEPVSALDVSIQAQIINLLQDLQRDCNLTYLFIAHDMSVVKYISTRIGVMYLGHLLEQAYTDDLFGMPMHPYTQALFSAVPETNPHIRKTRIVLKGEVPSPLNPPSGCVFHTRCPYAMPICKTVPPCQKEISRDHFVSCHLYDDEVSQG